MFLGSQEMSKMRHVVGLNNEQRDVGQKKSIEDSLPPPLSLCLFLSLLNALNCAHMASAGITEEADLLVLGSCYLHEMKAIGSWAVM